MSVADGRPLFTITVWYPPLTVKFKKKLDILHYKPLRIPIKDWTRIYAREMSDLLGRQKPKVITDYMTGSILIKSHIFRKATRLCLIIIENEFQIRRTGRIQFFDSTIKKIGQQSISNRLDN